MSMINMLKYFKYAKIHKKNTLDYNRIVGNGQE